MLESAAHTSFLLLFTSPYDASYFFCPEEALDLYRKPPPKHQAGKADGPQGLAVDSTCVLGCVLPKLLLFPQSQLMNGSLKHSLDAPGI